MDHMLSLDMADQRQGNSHELQGVRRLSSTPYLKEFAEAHCASLAVAPAEALQQQMIASKALRQVQTKSSAEQAVWRI